MMIQEILNLNMRDSLRKKPKYQVDKFSKATKTIATDLKKYINENETKKVKDVYTLADYEELKKIAQKGVSVEEVVNSDLPEATKEALMVELIDFNNKLAALVPVNSSQTIFGIDEKDPSDFEKNKFIRAMRVIEDPTSVLNLLMGDRLSWYEMDILREFYPAYNEALITSLMDVITAKGETNVKLPNKKNYYLSVMLNIPRLTPDILAAEAPQEAPSQGKADIKVPDAVETPNQRINNR